MRIIPPSAAASLICISLLLTACGQKGPLELPPKTTAIPVTTPAAIPAITHQTSKKVGSAQARRARKTRGHFSVSVSPFVTR